MKNCNHCDGIGSIARNICRKCSGEGMIFNDSIVEIEEDFEEYYDEEDYIEDYDY